NGRAAGGGNRGCEGTSNLVANVGTVLVGRHRLGVSSAAALVGGIAADSRRRVTGASDLVGACDFVAGVSRRLGCRRGGGIAAALRLIAGSGSRCDLTCGSRVGGVVAADRVACLAARLRGA